MVRRVPLAFSILTHDKKRLIVAVASISFASILMFQQQGYKHALYDSSSEIIRQLDAKLIVFSEARFAVSAEQRFPRTSLDQVAGLEGVTRAVPIYIESTIARFRSLEPTGDAVDHDQRNGVPHRARPIRVIGVPLDRQPFRLGIDRNKLNQLAAPRTALMDRLSKPEYGISPGIDTNRKPQSAELANRAVSVVGFFSLGQDFVFDGNLLMSEENFADYFAVRAPQPLSIVDLGAVQLDPGASTDDVKDRVAQILPPGTQVLTKEEYIQRENEFWAKSTPIGMIFTVGAVMGFVVGVIICYQILVDDISNQIAEYATLIAMGYSNLYLCRVVISQAGMLAIASFAPSLLVTLAAFKMTNALIGLEMALTPWRAFMVLSLTFGMCILSSLLAIRRLMSADPASLFR